MSLSYQTQLAGSEPATHAVMWMHGLGASSQDFMDIVPWLKLDAAQSIQFIFPDAPKRAVTINQGYRMPAWYDITHLDLQAEEDVNGIQESTQLLLDTLQTATALSPQNIALVGFSQGAAMAMHLAFTSGIPFAGVAGISGYLTQTSRRQWRAPSLPLKCWLGHGTLDPIVPIHLAHEARDWINEHHLPLAYEEHPILHNVYPKEMQSLGQWLSQLFAKPKE